MESAIDSFSRYRTSRGNGFPARGSGMMEPTQMKPKPRHDNESSKSPFLSKPAARPTGLDRSTPAKVVLSRGLDTLNPPAADSTCHGNDQRKTAFARAWLRSADRANSAGASTLRYRDMIDKHQDRLVSNLTMTR